MILNPCESVLFQFSSVQFYLAKVNYSARIHIRIVSWQGSPEETKRLMKPGLPSHKEISKMKFAEYYALKINVVTKN